MPRRWVLLPIAVVLAAGSVAYWTWSGADVRWTVLATLGYLATIAGGLLAWGRRPDSRIGPLLLAWGAYGLVGGVGARWSPVLFLVWFCATPLYWILLAHTLLTYPDGRAHTAAERWFLRIAYATPLLWLAIATFDAPVLYRTVRPVVAAVLGLWLLALIVRRRLRMTPAQRRSATPVLWATAGPLGVFLYATALNLIGNATPIPKVLYDAYHWATPAVSFWVPAALVVGLYRSKLARADVASLLVRLRTASVDDLRAELAAVLRDPTLEIAAERPPGDARASTALGAGLLLLHHPSARDEDPELFDAAVAAAAVKLDNARLTERVRAQLAEVTASRERLVHAADEERGRIERDLHDGAQQQLIGVGMALESARMSVPEGSTTAQLLDEANDQLRASIAELRALARGLRPALLAERGLEVALQELRRRAPVPVSLTVEVPGRLDPAVETAAYFVVAESLQNASRHASGARVEVELRRAGSDLLISVRDDGPGGADQRNGSGLRGLADRVAAIGGRLTVASAPGEGTTVSARVPAPERAG
jgi:signal transduction histidine kinase